MSEPPWKGVFKKKDQVENGLDISSSNVDTSDVPSAPSAHLTAKDIVYEVDVDIPDEEEKKEEDNDERESLVLESITEESDEDSTESTPT